MFVCTLLHIFSLNESELFRYETVDLLITDPAKLLINLLDETEKNKNDKKNNCKEFRSHWIHFFLSF